MILFPRISSQVTQGAFAHQQRATSMLVPHGRDELGQASQRQRKGDGQLTALPHVAGYNLGIPAPPSKITGGKWWVFFLTYLFGKPAPFILKQNWRLLKLHRINNSNLKNYISCISPCQTPSRRPQSSQMQPCRPMYFICHLSGDGEKERDHLVSIKKQHSHASQTFQSWRVTLADLKSYPTAFPQPSWANYTDCTWQYINNAKKLLL